MTRSCTRCRESFDAKGSWQKLCWRCWREDRDDELRQTAYEEGYRAGLRARPRRAARPQAIPTEFVRDAIALCHPDRHPSERYEQANRVTAALLALRDVP